MPKQKCFSKCRKKTENACGPKMCKYVKGKKYQYCRLGHKYKLDANCNITRRKLKKKISKKKARLDINSFINKTQKRQKKLNPHSNKGKNTKKQTIAANKIQTFMNKNKSKIKSRFLQSICSDSGVCLAFGKNSDEIKQFFKGFIGFDYATSDLKRLGKPSNNGFVNEVTYEREKYTAHTIIKSSSKSFGDNLFYEYLCGLLVNKWNTRFPCFLETYGVFSYKKEAFWNQVKKTQITSISEFIKYVDLLNSNKININSKLYDDLLNQSCLNSKHIAIMIQHIKGAITLRDLFKKQLDKTHFARTELVTLLFQLYFPLHILKNNFTHYDLHSDNVLLYKPYANKYIHYHYVLSSGKIISFKSVYVAKIIDYGRCYFKDDKNADYNSTQVYDSLCKNKNCDPDCGTNYGYYWLNEKRSIDNNTFIHSRKANVSHDLRLLNNIKNDMKYYKINIKNVPLYTNVLNKLKFDNTHGTSLITESRYPLKVSNVTDALNGLNILLGDNDFIYQNNLKHKTLDKIGDLYIYQNDRPMKFNE
jgi:hypothetical protein